jgi:transposase
MLKSEVVSNYLSLLLLIFCFMEFRELTDVEWGVISAFLPPKPRRASSGDRSLINGILYVVATGCRWREMPRRYGSYVTAWRRLQEAGVGVR